MSRGDEDGFGGGGDAGQAEAGGEFALGRGAAGGEDGVFGVLDDHGAEAAGVGEGEAHQAGVADGALAVREGDRAGFAEQADLGQFLAAAAAG